MKTDLDQLRKLLEQRSAELTTVYRELYQETARRWLLEKELKNFRDRLEKMMKMQGAESEDTLTKHKGFGGFLTICSSCKKILNEKGIWYRVEKFIEDRTEVKFTHSICPDCSKKLYPQIHEEDR